MTNKTPIFPIHEPQHFSDYGFDSQIDYFQVLEEARKHKRDTTSSSFKLQKPISKDETSKKIKKNRKQRWWKNALHFFKRKRTSSSCSSSDKDYGNIQCMYGGQQHCSVSGPVYLTDSRSGPATPYHRTFASRPSSGLASTFNIPYFSLADINMEHARKISSSPVPIYLVT